MSSTADKINSVADARYFAERRTPKSIFQMFDAGSGASVTARQNVQAFEDLLLRPHSATFHPKRDLSTTVFGHTIDLPVILSSVGALKAGHVDGELAATHVAGAAGTIQFVSGVTTTPIETIVAEATGPVYQQIYYIGGRQASAPLIQRARDAGVAGIVLIADSAAPNVGAEILYPERARMPLAVTVPEAIKFLPQLLTKPGWAIDFVKDGLRMPPAALTRKADGTSMSFIEAAGGLYDETPRYEDLPWIREHFDGPIILKGVVTADAARKAVDAGVNGIVVSNHGGNMLDGTIPSLRALPEVVDAVGDQVDVIMDGGIRRGTDIAKALALGAKAVSIGRAYVYGLLADGEPGVARIVDILRNEFDSALGWLGVAAARDLDPSLLEFPASWTKTTLDDVLQAASERDSATA